MLFLCHFALVCAIALLIFLYTVTSVSLLEIVIRFLLFVLVSIGLTQLVYAIPLGLRLKRKRRFKAVKGVVIGAAITLVMNVSYFIFLLWALSTGLLYI